MTPLYLYMENFVSHTKSPLNFELFNCALVLGLHNGDSYISNGTGKSSIFDAIGWALYGKSRFSSKERIVQYGKDKCCVEFVFTLGNETFKIVRRLDLKANVSEVVFSKKEGDLWESKIYTGDTNTITNANIVDKIGMNYDAFVNIVYFRQNDIAGFATAPTGKRKDILKEILQIGMWDIFQKDAKEQEKKLNGQLEIIEEKVRGFNGLDGEMKTNKAQLIMLDKKMVDLQRILGQNKEELKNCETKILNMEVALASKKVLNKNNIQRELESIKNNILVLRSKKDNLVGDIEDIRHKSTSLSVKLDKYKIELEDYVRKCLCIAECSYWDDIEKIREEMAFSKVPIRDDIAFLPAKEKEFVERQKNLNSLNLQLNQLLMVKIGEECPVCLTQTDDIVKVSNRRETKANNLKIKIKEETDICESLRLFITDAENSINNSNKFAVKAQNLYLAIKETQSKISRLKENETDGLMSIKRLKIEWEDLKKRKETLENLLSKSANSLQLHKDLETEINKKAKMIEKINGLQNEYVDFSIKHGSIKGYLEELERRKSQKNILISKRTDIIADIEVYSSLTRAFGKDGIQAIIMENVTEDLKNYSNSILKQICKEQLAVDFITQKQTATGSWREDFNIKIRSNGSDLNFEDLSGGEQVRVAFALRLALSHLLMRRVGSNIKFLLLDEIDQSLDKQGIDVLVEIIKNLSDEFKILLITHNDQMKDKFDHIISVQKQTGGSFLTQNIC